MTWKIILHSKVYKQLKKLPENINLLTQLLAKDLSMFGPCPGKQWPNFGKLSKEQYHCHLIKGRPTYVACWKIINKPNRRIEVYYVGTHENAPY